MLDIATQLCIEVTQIVTTDSGCNILFRVLTNKIKYETDVETYKNKLMVKLDKTDHFKEAMQQCSCNKSFSWTENCKFNLKYHNWTCCITNL